MIGNGYAVQGGEGRVYIATASHTLYISVSQGYYISQETSHLLNIAFE